MKTISNNFKNEIKQFGREIDAYITYSISGTSYELDVDNINSISLHYEGNILKSVMKQLDIDVMQDIPLKTEINLKFGVKISDNDVINYRDNYEYIDYGNFIVYSSEKEENEESYKIICYDKLLNSMIDYESFATYPITIRNYINALCSHINLTFANSTDTFANYDKEIPNELYLDENGNTLNYTFRDVLDELAQVTASTICINADDQLEIRYINDTQDTIDEEYLKDINVNFGETTDPINTITFKRSADSDIVSLSNPIDLQDNLKNEIVINDNQILNQNNRADYLEDILDQLYGLSYSINDFSSTGITYYELCDKYNVSITKYDNEENPTTIVYPCIMFNDEINITQGLSEHIHTDLPSETETDYNTTSKEDRTMTRATLIVDKQVGKISAVVGKVDELNETINGEYILTNDTIFKDKDYYILIGTEYDSVDLYYLTEDTTFQSGKTYYILNDGVYEIANVTIGATIPSNTYYETLINKPIPSDTYYELNGLEPRLKQAELTLTEQGVQLDIKTQKIDDSGNTTSFKTTNYTLDSNGFLIENGGYKSLSDTTGQFYYDNDTMIAKYTKDGSVQKDLAIFGKYYYGIDDENVNVEQFTKDNAMFMGQMYEDSNNEMGFGHFYNGS